MQHRPSRSSLSSLLGALGVVSVGALGAACASHAPDESAGTQSGITSGDPNGGAAGEACVFDCSAWDSYGLGQGSGAPRAFASMMAAGGFVGAPGTMKAGAGCVPDAVPAKLRDKITSAPPRPGPIPTFSSDSGVGTPDADGDMSSVVAGAYRYACLADGYMLKNGQNAPPAADEDVQSYFERECVAAGACAYTDVSSDAALSAVTAAADGSSSFAQGADWVERSIEQAIRTPGAVRTLDWDPNAHAPRNWWGRRIVAHITEGPCRAFNAFDRLIARIDNRWGVYASYGAAGGAGGALRFDAAYAYDLRNYESSAYFDAGVNIGFNASIALTAARGIALGGANARYSSIHNFFGGEYGGVNGSVSTPFAKVGVGMQIAAAIPAAHPWTLEVSATFGIGGTPFEANATVGQIVPIDVGTRRLRGITQGWVNVFDDEYGRVAFDGAGAAGRHRGNYERMRNSPNANEMWKAGSMANSAVRFASAPDLAAVFIFRAAFQQAWRGMRAVCN